MKKKIFIIPILIVVLAGCFFVGKTFMGTRPFKNLSENDIADVAVELMPPGMKFAVNDDEKKLLVNILRKVVTYQQDNTQYAGQSVIYTLTMKNGEQITINAYNPLIIINGIGYKTKYEPCEELSQLGNNLESSKDGK